jgi:hypothetical protein
MVIKSEYWVKIWDFRVTLAWGNVAVILEQAMLVCMPGYLADGKT